VLTSTPFQFCDQHHDTKTICWEFLFIKTFKYLLSVFEIQLGHRLNPLDFALTLNSFTCIKIKNEILCNSCKKIKMNTYYF
jgi:hypothetical protein